MNNIIEDLGKAGIIVADWDIRKKYPYKTFTVDYSTWISYISRKPVPAGIKITNINYWKPVIKPSEEMRLWLQDIDNKINSFLESIGGTAFSIKFGDSNLVGICQKALTEAFDGEDLCVKDDLYVKFADKDYNTDIASGLGRVYLRKNLTYIYAPWVSVRVNGTVYLMYYDKTNDTLYGIYNENTGKGLILLNNLVAEKEDYNTSELPEEVQENYLAYSEYDNVYTITLPNESTITSTDLNQTRVYRYEDGKTVITNILTQNMMVKSNTIYYIQYDFDLDNGTLNIPENCILIFNGGSIKNGTINTDYVLINDWKFDDVIFGDSTCFDFINPISVPVDSAKKFIETIISYKSYNSTVPTVFLFNSNVPYDWDGILKINKNNVTLTGGGTIRGHIEIGVSAETYSEYEHAYGWEGNRMCIKVENLTFDKIGKIGRIEAGGEKNTVVTKENAETFCSCSTLEDVTDDNYTSISLFNANHIKISNCFFHNVPFPIAYKANRAVPGEALPDINDIIPGFSGGYRIQQIMRRVCVSNCDFERCYVGIYVPSNTTNGLEYGDLETAFCNFFPYLTCILSKNIDGFKCYNNVMNTGLDDENSMNISLLRCGQIVITNNSFYGERNKCALELIKCSNSIINSNSFAAQFPQIKTINNIGCIRVINDTAGSILSSLSIQNNTFSDVDNLPIFVYAIQNRGTVIDGNILQDSNYDMHRRTYYYINGGFIKKLQSNYENETLLNAHLLDTRMDIIRERLLIASTYGNESRIVNKLNDKVYGTVLSSDKFKVDSIKKIKSITAIRCNSLTKYDNSEKRGSDGSKLYFLFNGITFEIPFDDVVGKTNTQALEVLRDNIKTVFKDDYDYFDYYIISETLWIKSKTVIDMYTPAAELTFNRTVYGCFDVAYQNLGYSIKLVDVDEKPRFTLPDYNAAIDARSDGKIVDLFGHQAIIKTSPNPGVYNCTYYFRNYTGGNAEVYFLNDTYFSKVVGTDDTATVLASIIDNIYTDIDDVEHANVYTHNGVMVTLVEQGVEYPRYMTSNQGWYTPIRYHVVKHEFVTPTDIKLSLPDKGESNNVTYSDSNAFNQKPINQRRGFSFFDETCDRPLWWNGTGWMNAKGLHSKGTTEERPVGIHLVGYDDGTGDISPTQDATHTIPIYEGNLDYNFDLGFEYFDTDLGFPIYAQRIDGTNVIWVTNKGFTACKNRGTTEERPTGTILDAVRDKGFEFFDTELGIPIYAQNIGVDTVTWVKADGTNPDTNV